MFFDGSGRINDAERPAHRLPLKVLGRPLHQEIPQTWSFFTIFTKGFDQKPNNMENKADVDGDEYLYLVCPCLG